MSFYSGAKKIFSPIVKLLFRVKITGLENLPEQGGAVISSNHSSILDVVVLGASLTRLLNFMAKKELFKLKLFGKFLGKLGAFPVDRGGADVRAIKHAISLVEKGELVNIFPQGTRYVRIDPSLTVIKSGVGMISYHSKCPVVPIFLKSRKNHVHMFGKTEVIIGRPITYEEFGFEKGGMAEYEKASEKVFSEICALGGYEYSAEKAYIRPKFDRAGKKERRK